MILAGSELPAGPASGFVGGLAHTGTDIGPLLGLVVILLAFGCLTLWMAHRKAAR